MLLLVPFAVASLLSLVALDPVSGQGFVFSEDDPAAAGATATGDKPCVLPTGNASSCVELNRCSHLAALIANLQKPIPGDVAKVIVDMHFCPRAAGADQQQPVLVCCPPEGIRDPPVPIPPSLPNDKGQDDVGRDSFRPLDLDLDIDLVLALVAPLQPSRAPPRAARRPRASSTTGARRCCSC